MTACTQWYSTATPGSKCVLEHDEINVHVVAAQSQVIANIKINFIHVCYWLIIDKAPNTGREYKIRDF